MDFARKQLEKYGWKEGEGLGKEGNQGMSNAIKPHYKHGKEGMGFELGKELTDAWWTRSYDDSLKRINVDTESENVTVSTPKDPNSKDTPLVQMRKRMMKANFTEFSKGGTLNQGKLIKDGSSSDSSDNEDGPPPPKISILNDDELLKACGGRTAHKAARFGHKLSGKLARLAAQDKYLLENPEVLIPKEKKGKIKKSKKSKKSKSNDDSEPLL